MRPTPYVASLRVYEPITEFKSGDQARWSQISYSAATIKDEQSQALSRVITSNFFTTKLDVPSFDPTSKITKLLLIG